MQSIDFQLFAKFLAVFMLFRAAASVAVAAFMRTLLKERRWHLWRWHLRRWRHRLRHRHRKTGTAAFSFSVFFTSERRRHLRWRWRSVPVASASENAQNMHRRNGTQKLFRICLNCFLKMYPHVYCKNAYHYGACAWICAKRSYAYFCADFVFSAVADAQSAAKNRPFCVRTQLAEKRRFF